MTRTCAIPSCKNSQKRQPNETIFHQLPTNKQLANKWLLKINNPKYFNCDDESKKRIFVCSKHFHVTDYRLLKRTKGRRGKYLKQGFVPHLHLSKKVAEEKVEVRVCSDPLTEEVPSTSVAIILDEKPSSSSGSPSNPSSGHGTSSTLSTIVPDADIQPFETSSSVLETSLLSVDVDSTLDESFILPTNEKNMILIYEKCLKQLFRRCEVCGDVIVSIDKKTKGGKLTISCKCINFHDTKWESSPDIRKMSVVNLCTAASVLYSGSTYTEISKYFSLLNIPFMSEQMFYWIQRKYLIPVIQRYYDKKHKQIVQSLLDPSCGSPLTIMGDARSDSPGFSAKYTTYTFIEESTEKIIATKVLQKTESSSSIALEMDAFKVLLNDLLASGLNIGVVVTDRSASIRKYMRECHPSIQHQFDIWHVCKGVKKKLLSKAAKKSNKKLLGWIRSITNHLWWSCETCNGDLSVLLSKWLSLLYHIQNVHTWTEHGVEKKCLHAPLSEEHILETKWLEKDSEPFIALSGIVKEKRLLNDLQHMTLFKHTGSLESFHNVILKFAPKRIHFDKEGMVARTQLAVLDHNENVGRVQATNKKGKPLFHKVYSKAAKEWIVKIKYDDKTSNYANELVERTMALRQEPGVPDSELKMRRSIAPTPAPELEELLTKRRRARDK